MFKVIKNIAMFVPNKVKQINAAVEKTIELPGQVSKTYTYVTKACGAGVGGTLAGKGSADLVEALVCQDGICAAVSTIGLMADGLQIMASFVPGPNVTTVITLPISLGCKTFVWACKKSKLPWGGC